MPARKPTSARPQTAATETATEPTPEHDDEVFDLDALVIEAREAAFTFLAGGKRFVMAVPEELDWLKQSALADIHPGDYRPVLRHLLGLKQYEQFVKHAMSQAKIEALLAKWRAHHGLQPGE